MSAQMDDPKATLICWLVVNTASGSHSAEAVQQVVSGLSKSGHAPQRIIRLPGEKLPERAELEAAGVTLLVTFAGDGTANSQITRLHDWAGQLLVLPGGTQNLLAKRLHGAASAEQILAALADGWLEPRRLSMIRTAHGDALCEIVAGPGATWSDVRQMLRGRDVAALATKLAEAIRQSAGGPAVCVVEPALGKPAGYPAIRLSPQDELMAVDGYCAEGLADYARQSVAILRRNFRQGPHDELGTYAQVLCRSHQPIELMIDGERATGSAEERFITALCPVEFLALV